MLDDVRNHDAMPTDEEREWMALHEVVTIVRAIVLATVALGIGWGASMLIGEQVRPAVASFAGR
jgi:hypothetical protein